MIQMKEPFSKTGKSSEDHREIIYMLPKEQPS